MKKILIAGAHSYIGDSFKAFLDSFSHDYKTEVLETKDIVPFPAQFATYDVVFCVTGIAHIKETKNNQHLYYDINRDLVVAIAKAAKEAGVRQFILLSSMSVYGLTVGHITKETTPNPNTAYGNSKLQADMEIKKLETNNFIFTCLRPPMVYGKNCSGNYQLLRKFALKSPFFPNYQNKRSMIYIGNLCVFVKKCIDFEKKGIFFPQNASYINTSSMIKLIANEHKKNIKLTKVFNLGLRITPIRIFKKVFGNLTYELVDTVDHYDFTESIRITEGE